MRPSPRSAFFSREAARAGGAALALALALASGCATERASSLPRVEKGENAEFDGAYRDASRVYRGCARDYEKYRFAWQIPVAVGSAGLTAASLGVAAVIPLFVVNSAIPDAQEPSLVMVSAAGLGLVAAISGGTGAYFGAQAPAAIANEADLGKVLASAETRIADAAEKKDVSALLLLTRELQEDCRAVQIARDNTSSQDLLKDLARYRKERAQETKRADGLSNDKQGLEKKLADLNATLEKKEAERKAALGSKEQTEGRLRDTESRLGEREAENVQLHGQLFKLENELAALDEERKKTLEENRKAAAKERAAPELNKALAQELATGRFVLRERDDGHALEIRAGVLFPPGETTLSTEGKKVLLKLAATLRKLKGRSIRVEGHAAIPDAAGAPPTWSETAARAVAVTAFLQELGLDASRLEVGARSHYAPVVPRNAEEAKLRNERIELHLLKLPTEETDRWRPPASRGRG